MSKKIDILTAVLTYVVAAVVITALAFLVTELIVYVSAEETEPPKVVEPVQDEEPEETPLYFDVPLSEDVQDHIFTECERYGISPEIVIAMIERESSYDYTAVGDDGRSIGLMQIQTKWNLQRMIDLDCTDLLDPYENITVGIDILAELQEQNNDIYWMLMAYNGGASYANRQTESGVISDYALTVVERSKELERIL